MDKRWNIILSGSGGQGLGLAGEILGKTAINEKNYEVAHNQSYGSRARGGFSQSSLVISTGEIAYPLVEKADLLIALTDQAYSTNEPEVVPEGTTIFDSSFVNKPTNRTKELGYEFANGSLEMEHPRGITLMAIGAALSVLEIVPPDSVKKTMKEYFEGQILELNIKAFERGLNLG